ncbi:hypothetical protein J6590_100996 [Homalodisca vitripennis]|nr:hypothetical protein J6590_100996 [Homalodisca vitripennis]
MTLLTLCTPTSEISDIVVLVKTSDVRHFGRLYYVSKMSDQSSDEERPIRRASPVSENILFGNIIESGVGYVDDLSDSFVSNISDSKSSDDAKSESEGGITGFDDDTDNDPDWEQSGEPSSDDECPVSKKICSKPRPRPTNALIDETIDDVISGSGRPNLPSTSSFVVEAFNNQPEVKVNTTNDQQEIWLDNADVDMPLLNTIEETIEHVIRNSDDFEIPDPDPDIPLDLYPNILDDTPVDCCQ